MARHRDDEDLVGNGGDGRKLDRDDNKSRSGKNGEEAARSELRSFVERIERLEEEKTTVNDDIKQVYGEAKGKGYDTKVLRKIIALRKKDAQERTEEEMVMNTYLMALGMAPLGGVHDDV